jgi:hypothetical protein
MGLNQSSAKKALLGALFFQQKSSVPHWAVRNIFKFRFPPHRALQALSPQCFKCLRMGYAKRSPVAQDAQVNTQQTSALMALEESRCVCCAQQASRTKALNTPPTAWHAPTRRHGSTRNPYRLNDSYNQSNPRQSSPSISSSFSSLLTRSTCSYHLCQYSPSRPLHLIPFSAFQPQQLLSTQLELPCVTICHAKSLKIFVLFWYLIASGALDQLNWFLPGTHMLPMNSA